MRPARIKIQGKHHYVECIVLLTCSDDVILDWNFLGASSTFIDCGAYELTLDVDSSLEPDVHYFSQRRTATQVTLLPARSFVILSITVYKAYSGDALVKSMPDIIGKSGVVVPSCVATFDPFSADVLVVNATDLDIVIPKDV